LAEVYKLQIEYMTLWWAPTFTYGLVILYSL